MLWVRSQNKRVLIPNPNFSIDIDGTIVSEFDFNKSLILGKYKNEQRAIEVLDEIEKGLTIEEKDISPELAKLRLLMHIGDIIYNMPEE